MRWIFQGRDGIVLALFLVVIILIFGMLCKVIFIDGASYSEMADDLHTKTSVDYARRGTIYDRNGEVIASSVESVTIDVNPNDIDYSVSVSDEEKSSREAATTAVASLFEQYLGPSSGKTFDDYYALVTTQGTSYVIIQRKCDTTTSDALKQALNDADLVGVYYEEDSTRIYPNGTIGSQVIGAVDIDGNGIAGLELEYDDMLAGEDGEISQEKSSSGIPIAGGAYVVNEAVDGEDMVISLDIKLQKRVEESLLEGLQSYEAEGGSAIVMDASTGEIYAACSYSKTAVEQDTSDGEEGEDTDSGDSEAYEYTFDSGRLWSITDTYEPGSTFKALTATAVIGNSAVTPETVFYVPSALDVYDTTITDSHDHDDENDTFDEIIAESSNIGTVIASREVDNQTLYNTYNAFKMGQKTGVDFPGEASGLLETPEDWDGVQEANIVFGQGVAVTGLQIARAFAAIEQRGTIHTPHFLTSLPNDDDEQDQQMVSDLKVSETVADAATCESVIQMLNSVVTYGTGVDAAIDGYTVVGKTGTAEVAGSDGTYLANTYIVSFCGWLEGSGCDLVCLVTMDGAKSNDGGGGVCGPVFADIMQFAADTYHASTNAG